MNTEDEFYRISRQATGRVGNLILEVAAAEIGPGRPEPFTLDAALTGAAIAAVHTLKGNADAHGAALGTTGQEMFDRLIDHLTGTWALLKDAPASNVLGH